MCGVGHGGLVCSLFLLLFEPLLNPLSQCVVGHDLLHSQRRSVERVRLIAEQMSEKYPTQQSFRWILCS